MAHSFIRILSDVHYGDRVSFVHSLSQLDALLSGVSGLVLNGDTLDTRPGPHPATIQALRLALTAYLRTTPTTLLTGNHDPDITDVHLHELAGNRVLITHGDIMFDDIVPWGPDAALARQLVARERTTSADQSLEQMLHAHRRAARAIPRRIKPEFGRWKYFSRYFYETIWPPTRISRVLRAWAEMPARTAALALTHRPQARFVVVGHTHRPGVWRLKDGRVVINTGSYCRPLGRLLVDVSPDHLVVRRVVLRGRDFHPGDTVTEFALAPAGF